MRKSRAELLAEQAQALKIRAEKLKEKWAGDADG